MVKYLLVDVIIDVLKYTSLPKHPGKLYYATIRDTHCLLTENAAPIDIPLGGGQKDYLCLVLTATHYSLISPSPFIRPTNPNRTPTITTWAPSVEEKRLLRDNKEKHLQ